MENFRKRARNLGGTPRMCQDAMVEMLRELFKGKKYTGQEGLKELKVFKQNLPIPKRQRDRKADTDEAAAPYIVVEMLKGVIDNDDEPQLVAFSLVICAYDKGTERDGYQDVTNIREDIIQRVCEKPYFGGIYTVEKPIDWAVQRDNSAPYYYGIVNLIVTCPAMTQDTELEELV